MNEEYQMMRRLYLICFYVCFISVIPKVAFSSSEDILIVFSGEETGNLEPCGCYVGQIGGISRRHTIIDQLKKKNNVIPVSLGDLPSGNERQDEIKMEIFSHAMRKMGYILHNVGEKEIEISPRVLSYLSQTNNFTFLSSNIQINYPFPVIINKYVINEYVENKRSFKIAFLGILSKIFSDNILSNDVCVDDPVSALRPLIKELRNKVDFMVLLSHAPFEESVEFAKLFPEIGLIITGHGMDEPTDTVIYIKDTPIVSPGRNGRFIGIARYSITNKGLKRKSIEVIPLDNKYNDSQEVSLLLKEYQQILKNEDLLGKTYREPLPNGLSYVGSSACGICHKIVYEHWSNTAHGKSYDTLVNTGHQYDPECIKCHTIGFGHISGFLDYDETQHLINVGCESCHGAGSLHINLVNKNYGKTNEGGCEMCHDSEHSPGFEFKEYWEKIKHPREVLKQLPNIVK